MEKSHEWENDPSVQAMRRVFSRIEKDQDRFLTHMKISPLDCRIREWRETALAIFERICALASIKGVAVNEETAAQIYVNSLASVMTSCGIKVAKELLSASHDVKGLFKELSR